MRVSRPESLLGPVDHIGIAGRKIVGGTHRLAVAQPRQVVGEGVGRVRSEGRMETARSVGEGVLGLEPTPESCENLSVLGAGFEGHRVVVSDRFGEACRGAFDQRHGALEVAGQPLESGELLHRREGDGVLEAEYSLLLLEGIEEQRARRLELSTVAQQRREPALSDQQGRVLGAAGGAVGVEHLGEQILGLRQAPLCHEHPGEAVLDPDHRTGTTAVRERLEHRDGLAMELLCSIVVASSEGDLAEAIEQGGDGTRVVVAGAGLGEELGGQHFCLIEASGEMDGRNQVASSPGGFPRSGPEGTGKPVGGNAQ